MRKVHARTEICLIHSFWLFACYLCKSSVTTLFINHFVSKMTRAAFFNT